MNVEDAVREAVESERHMLERESGRLSESLDYELDRLRHQQKVVDEASKTLTNVNMRVALLNKFLEDNPREENE